MATLDKTRTTIAQLVREAGGVMPLSQLVAQLAAMEGMREVEASLAVCEADDYGICIDLISGVARSSTA